MGCAASGSPSAATQIRPGERLPYIELDRGFPNIEKVNILAHSRNKKVPGYLAKEAELKAKGIDEVIVYCVNDAAVMKAWAKDQFIEGTMFTFLADPSCAFTKAIGMCINDSGVQAALGNVRCKRFALVVEDGVVKHVRVSEAPGDPAGDKDPQGPITRKTRVEHILELL